MQTFLPYPDFVESARCLDWRRLGKQRLECAQILAALEGRSRGWVNHPAARMWKGHADALRAYQRAVILEWIHRGYRNTMLLPEETPYETPPWLGSSAFHASHRSNLLRKDLAWYGQYGWKEPPNLPYVWPV